MNTTTVKFTSLPVWCQDAMLRANCNVMPATIVSFTGTIRAQIVDDYAPILHVNLWSTTGHKITVKDLR